MATAKIPQAVYVLISAPMRDRLKLLAVLQGETMRTALDRIVEDATLELTPSATAADQANEVAS